MTKGLVYNYYRYYDPNTGRYITSDPIGLDGGLNTYGYVGGNPVNFNDPFGLVRWKGRFDYFGLDLGIGAIGWDFHLVSECVNNIAYYVHVDATAIQVSVGSPAGAGISDPWDGIIINDTYSVPDPYALSGSFSFSSFGHALFESSSGAVKVQVGSGVGVYSGNISGLDGGASGGAGLSNVDSFERIDFADECECEKWNQEKFGG